ncbi:hypothetical protein [Aquimarina atlantica]|uniref:hypothetical protein n=1 Tax=Aquimarina atlantica TaxID=1317122 RepID=UPI00054D180C|nr:hypothetical protein [Aquimarina atlantica]
MNTKIFLTIHGLIYTLFGVGMFLFPNIFWETYGAKLKDKYTFFLVQHTTIFLGGSTIVISFYGDFKENSEKAKKILYDLLFTSIIGDIITSLAIFKSIFYDFSWIDLIFFLGICILTLIKLK